MERFDKIIVTLIVTILVALIGCVSYNMVKTCIKNIEFRDTVERHSVKCCECVEIPVMTKDNCVFKVKPRIEYRATFGNDASLLEVTNGVLFSSAQLACVECAQNYTGFDLDDRYTNEVYERIVSDAKENGIEITSVHFDIQPPKEVLKQMKQYQDAQEEVEKTHRSLQEELDRRHGAAIAAGLDTFHPIH